MVIIRIAALAALVILGTTATASAQSGGYDPLNPLAGRAVTTVSRPAPARATVTWQPAANSYDAYLAEYRRWYATEQQRRKSEGSGFTRFLTGVSNSLSVADQALSVYEHGLDAKAL